MASPDTTSRSIRSAEGLATLAWPYLRAVSEGEWQLASQFLTAFQRMWTEHATAAFEVTPGAAQQLPHSLAPNGRLDQRTRDALVGALFLGTHVPAGIDRMPTNAGALPGFVSQNIAPLLRNTPLDQVAGSLLTDGRMNPSQAVFEAEAWMFGQARGMTAGPDIVPPRPADPNTHVPNTSASHTLLPAILVPGQRPQGSKGQWLLWVVGAAGVATAGWLLFFGTSNRKRRKKKR